MPEDVAVLQKNVVLSLARGNLEEALPGNLAEADKVKITRTKLDYQVGEFPPSFKSQAVLDDEVI